MMDALQLKPQPASPPAGSRLRLSLGQAGTPEAAQPGSRPDLSQATSPPLRPRGGTAFAQTWARPPQLPVPKVATSQ